MDTSGSAAILSTFTRVVDAFDLDRLRRCRIVSVGTGGAASYIEDMARCGVGEFVLIDPDVVSEPNLATQQAYRRDLGRPKVDVLAERLTNITAQVRVLPVQAKLEELDDTAVGQLIASPLVDGDPHDAEESTARRPLQTLLAGLTDDFFAQARVNRLAVHFGVSSLCAQVYKEGRGAEITFMYPGITPACHRCILESRYKAYLNDGYRNTVTSAGAPIFSTTRLNALKGFVTMALLHHEMFPLVGFPWHGGGDCSEKPSYKRWGGLLSRIGTRNLIQIRMEPDVNETLGLGVFNRVFGRADQERVFCDEAVWLPQQPLVNCPDCGGSGALESVKGTISDTRIIPA